MKRKSVLKALAFFGAMLFLAFANFTFNTSALPKADSLKVEVDTIEDNKYPSVKIGSQEWMTENLNVEHFRNGDPIPEAKTNLEWENSGRLRKPAWCYYQSDTGNGKIYGKLYNFFAVNDQRGLAPEGWHIPSDKEWRVLTKYLGDKEIIVISNIYPTVWKTTNAGGKMKSTGTKSWTSPNKDATNLSGFSGLPGGQRDYYGHFYSNMSIGFWWSSTIDGDDENYRAWLISLYYNKGDVDRFVHSLNLGLSVRCLRD